MPQLKREKQPAPLLARARRGRRRVTAQEELLIRGRNTQGGRASALPTRRSARTLRRRGDADDGSVGDAKRKRSGSGSCGGASACGGTGLRQFSTKVCEKVEAKGTTTYNEVADELVRELAERRELSGGDQSYDEKNIRRRVYDALNVLMAMEIIGKEKKEIHWCGLPSSDAAQELERARARRARLERSVTRKRAHLDDLTARHRNERALADRNKAQGPRPEHALPVPFLAVSVPEQTRVRCEMSHDRREVFFTFNQPFHVQDDAQILSSLDLQHEDVVKVTSPDPPPSIPPKPPSMPRVTDEDAFLSRQPADLRAAAPARRRAASA